MAKEDASVTRAPPLAFAGSAGAWGWRWSGVQAPARLDTEKG